MFLNKNRKFFLSRTQNFCPQQMLRARANGETFVTATMCPRLPGPLWKLPEDEVRTTFRKNIRLLERTGKKHLI